VRTVLGDVPADELGVTYAHEHLVIDGGRAAVREPEFLLNDIGRLTAELRSAATAGLRTAVDAMPADAGRNATLLAELSRRSGVQIVAPTGLHHDRYYGPSHWSARVSEDELADLFVADIEQGIDRHDYSGPTVARTEHRAGIIKVAGSEGGPSARDARIFRAAAIAHARTGVPILTHCEHGTGALEQIRLLTDAGVPAERLLLSHVDKVLDRGYHREILRSGAVAAYDQSFRWGDAPNGTLALLEQMAEDGLGDRVVLGMDAARSRYYRAYGGTPGLDFLLTGFTAQMAERGLDEAFRHRIFVTTPARVLALRTTTPPTHAAS
jgi:phosphotriesterase-related protein